MNSKLPAPAIAAATNPKSVGIVRDAKINDANVIYMMKILTYLINSVIA